MFMVIEKLGVSMYKYKDDILKIVDNIYDLDESYEMTDDECNKFDFCSNLMIFIICDDEIHDENGYVTFNQFLNVDGYKFDKECRVTNAIIVIYKNINHTKKDIANSLSHELNHIYQLYKSRNSNWFHGTMRRSQINMYNNEEMIKNLTKEERSVISEKLCTYLYNMFSESEYSSTICGSYFELINNGGDITDTHIYNLINNIKGEFFPLVEENITKETFKTYLKLFKECELNKYIRKDLTAFKDVLLKEMNRLLYKAQDDIDRILKLYRINESICVKSFGEFISE